MTRCTKRDDILHENVP